MTEKIDRRGMLRLAAGAGLMAASGSSVRAASDAPIVLGGLNQSLTGIAIQVMVNQKIDRKYGVAVEYRTYPTLDAVFNALRGQQVDVTSGGWTATAQFREKGFPLLMFFPIGRGNSLEVLVPKDSPYKTLADLKGKRIGSYAGAAGTATVLMRVITRKYFGYDPADSGNLQFASNALLPTLMDKGDLAGALMADPVCAKALVSEKYRSIGNLPEIYTKEVGSEFFWIGYSTNEAFAKKNPETLRSFTKAWVEAVAYVRANPDVYDSYVKALGFEGKLATFLRDRVNDDYTLQWDQARIDNMRQFAEFARSVMGPGYLDKFLPEAFTLDFVPKAT